MIELGKKTLATKKMYELLKTIIKGEFLPASLEDFKKAFEKEVIFKLDEPYKIPMVSFSYEISKKNFKVQALRIRFMPYGISWFEDKLLKDTTTFAKYNFYLDYQRLIGEKCNDLEYFKYLLRKNRYFLDALCAEVKEGRPSIFNFKQRRDYNKKTKQQLDIFEQKYNEHMEFVQLKIIDITREQGNK